MKKKGKAKNNNDEGDINSQWRRRAKTMESFKTVKTGGVIINKSQKKYRLCHQGQGCEGKYQDVNFMPT